MTDSQFWYHKGDIVELILIEIAEYAAGERAWHKLGQLGEVLGTMKYEPTPLLPGLPGAPIVQADTGCTQLLKIKFHDCKCPRSRIHPWCMQIYNTLVKIHPSSPRFYVGSRWDVIGKESI